MAPELRIAKCPLVFGKRVGISKFQLESFERHQELQKPRIRGLPEYTYIYLIHGPGPGPMYKVCVCICGHGIQEGIGIYRKRLGKASRKEMAFYGNAWARNPDKNWHFMETPGQGIQIRIGILSKSAQKSTKIYQKSFKTMQNLCKIILNMIKLVLKTQFCLNSLELGAG